MPSRSTLFRCAVVILAVTITCTAGARQVTVKLKSGQEISGELIAQTGQSITIRTDGGAERRLPLDQIDGPIRDRAGLTEEYRQRRSRVRDADYAGRLEIARWLYETQEPSQQREAYTLALVELEGVVRLKPDSQEARLMRDAVADRLKRLEGQAAPPGSPAAGQPRPDGDGPAADAKPQLLTPEQINRMKVFEVELSSRPTVVIPPKVVTDFLSQYTRDPVEPSMQRFMGRDGEREFKRLEGHQQLAVMFDVKAREFYDKVIIRDEPRSLQQWRTTFHTQYLQNYCGRCHGEGKAAGLNLVRGRPGDEATAYTNLVLLSRQQVGGLPMISRDAPERSPLLQYGLPRQESAMPHPEAQGWRPYFRNRSDPAFQSMMQWIRSLYTDPRDMVPDAGSAAAAGGA